MDVTKRLAYCVCVCLFLGQVRATYIPAEMNRTIQSLLKHYKIPSAKRFDGHPVFSRKDYLSFEKPEVRSGYMGGVLETYHKLFKKMLEQQPTPSPATSASPGATGANANANANVANMGSSVREQLHDLLRKVDKLKNIYYKEQGVLFHKLGSMHSIQTDALITQSKALWELPWLYEEASTLVNDKKRQRRQIRRNKKQR